MNEVDWVELPLNAALFLVFVLACLLQPVRCSGQSPESDPVEPTVQPADSNSTIYYKHRLDFSWETGVLFDNIPFVLDPLLGDKWKTNPLPYTLVPFISSLRWQLDRVRGPGFLRGYTDLAVGGTFTAITRGPESRYIAFVTGLRRNFVRPNWKTMPYLELRGGVGDVDAKGPQGIKYAQGEALTFTFISSGGVRYNFSSESSFSAGIAYMHISNAYLSGPKAYNFGINVFGPSIGVNFRLKPPPH